MKLSLRKELLWVIKTKRPFEFLEVGGISQQLLTENKKVGKEAHQHKCNHQLSVTLPHVLFNFLSLITGLIAADVAFTNEIFSVGC